MNRNIWTGTSPHSTEMRYLSSLLLLCLGYGASPLTLYHFGNKRFNPIIQPLIRQQLLILPLQKSIINQYYHASIRIRTNKLSSSLYGPKFTYLLELNLELFIYHSTILYKKSPYTFESLFLGKSRVLSIITKKG